MIVEFLNGKHVAAKKLLPEAPTIEEKLPTAAQQPLICRSIGQELGRRS